MPERDISNMPWLALVDTLRQAGERDDGAWSEVHRRLIRLAKVFTSSRGQPDPQIAEDVANRVATRLFESPDVLARLAALPNDKAVNGYLLVTVRNETHASVRRELRHHTGREGFDDSLKSFSDRVERANDIRDVLQSHLSAEELDLVRWRFWENLSLDEIAQRLGLRYHATAMRLQRIQVKLRAVFKSLEIEP